jgi:phenylalanyl-tRNA synthetase alpha chain
MQDVIPNPAEWLSDVQSATSLAQLDEIRVRVLGKKGELTLAMKQLGTLPAEDRKKAGAEYNLLKQSCSDAIASRKQQLEEEALNARFSNESLDMSLPARPRQTGSIHPVTKVMEEVTDIFESMGFSIALGPEIEDDFHNFTALHIPEYHPARQMHDTFYLKKQDDESGHLLRTHTSPVQIRAMQQYGAPLRVIAPGTTFRCDSDATHTPMFHQLEGFAIDRDIHFAELKGTLIHFVEQFFGMSDIPVRFRPSFFPFTEPSAEMDIGCIKKQGRIEIGSGDDWLEILGCGMVHPEVLRHGNIDPEQYQGFAFGVGIERLAMLKYGMTDLRPFFESDSRWLSHYSFSA